MCSAVAYTLTSGLKKMCFSKDPDTCEAKAVIFPDVSLACQALLLKTFSGV